MTESLATTIVVVFIWIAIWNLFEIILDQITKPMNKTVRIIFEIILYIAIIIFALYYAKKNNVIAFT
jgi:hypothetical protein